MQLRQTITILFITILFILISFTSTSQDTAYLRIHFLYGSRPCKKYRDTEQKWFGGILGGHVGIESDSNRIVNFLPNGKFHWFAKRNNRHSKYSVHSIDNFYSILGGNPDSVKKTIVVIPVTTQQRYLFDSISNTYIEHTPYDYALFGMRCGAATYDILSSLGILPKYSYHKTYLKIFYPKKLRKRLLRKAATNNWTIIKQDGSLKRKWEND